MNRIVHRFKNCIANLFATEEDFSSMSSSEKLDKLNTNLESLKKGLLSHMQDDIECISLMNKQLQDLHEAIQNMLNTIQESHNK